MKIIFSFIFLSVFSLITLAQEIDEISESETQTMDAPLTEETPLIEGTPLIEETSLTEETPLTEESSETTKSEYVKFTKDQRQFRSWAVGLYGGTAFLHRGDDLTSINDGNFLFGYDFNLAILKNINHTFAIGLQANIGQTNQQDETGGLIAKGETNYKMISLLGDLNLSSLFRRVDNKSKYKWAVHSYLNLGVLSYDTQITNVLTDSPGPKIEQKFDTSSVYGSLGTGLRYKISNALDAEIKANYVFTGEPEFEGILDGNRDDIFVTTNLGLIYKIGGNKNHENLAWHDPLGDLHTVAQKLADAVGVEGPVGGIHDENAEKILGGGIFCESGDGDDDSVCDDWDRELTTPIGARVDGSGVALDVDGDSVIDLYDNCLTVPGVARPIDDPKNGCPDNIVKVRITEVADQLNKELKNIQFDYNKATLRPVSIPKLDRATELIKQYPEYSFIIEGHTDAAGSFDYNLNLSQKRADAVLEYIVNKGVEKFRLRAVGKGESELYHAECNPANVCSDEMNEENRRVIFIPGDTITATKSRIVEQVEIIESSNNPIEQYQNSN